MKTVVILRRTLCVLLLVGIYNLSCLHGAVAADGFDPNANGNVTSIAIQTDGKILVGGYFTTIAGSTRNYIARLNQDGTLDTTFNPNAGG